jgi:dTDP-4-dehydrorhamnose reductase
MKIILTGANGLLGRRVAETLHTQGHTVIGTDADTLNITDFISVRNHVQEHQPDVVINCAAWTDVDGCARDPERAIQVNGYGAQNLALAAYDVGAAILQISSNEVFNGKKTTPYHEYDSTDAVNPYGYSKLIAERAIVPVNPRHYIVRTAWLFDSGGRNFIHAILNAAKAGKNLRVVTDEVANPTYNVDLAQAIVQLIQTQRYGTYHLTNAGACSRYMFARYVLDCAGFSETAITPISSKEWPRSSTPPAYAALANTAAASVGITLRTWQEAVAEFVLGVVEA